MQAIETEKAFKNLIESPALISIVLDSGFNREALSEVMSIWRDFNRVASNRWHLIFPIAPPNRKKEKGKGSYVINDHLNPDHYDAELAEDIGKQLRIPVEEFPAIVFLDHTHKSYFALPLNRGIGEDWRKHLRSIANICEETEQNLQRTNSDKFFKDDATKAVRQYLSRKKAAHAIGPAFGFFGSLLGIIGSPVSIFK